MERESGDRIRCSSDQFRNRCGMEPRDRCDSSETEWESAKMTLTETETDDLLHE